MTTPNRLDQLAAMFPVDGPHDDEQTADAARAVAELVRFLNYATQRPTGTAWPATLATVIGNTQAAVAGLDQTYRQTAARLVELARDPHAYIWNPDPDYRTPAATAQAVADHLDLARDALATVEAALARAHSLANRLGIED